MPKIKKPLTEQEIYQKLSYRCSVCEYSPYDIEQKALQQGATPDVAERIVDRLTDQNFINEQRYAQSFVHDKFEFNHWGRKKIAMTLLQKRISSTIADLALSAIDDQQYQSVLRELLTTKSRQLKEPDPYKRSQKLLAFAVSRGFEPHLAYDIIDAIGSEEDI